MAAKKSKKITLGDIPSIGSSSQNNKRELYINSHVTPFVGRLLHRGRVAVKEKKIGACWVTASSLMVKLSNSSAPIAIKSASDLNEILGTDSIVTSETKLNATGKRTRELNESLSPSTEAQPKQKQKQLNGPRVKNSAGPKSSKQQKPQQQQRPTEGKK